MLIFRHITGGSWIETRGNYNCECGRKGYDPETHVFSGGLWRRSPIWIHPEDMKSGKRKFICYGCGNAVKLI